jgi:hypothetical protein
MPIAQMVRAILDGKVELKHVPDLIMTRQLRSEFD